jgi:hypothetical protein
VKKGIALSIAALLGSLVGYFFAPVISLRRVQSADPPMFAQAMLSDYKRSVVCDCNDRPAPEGAKELSQYLATLKMFRAQNPESEVLAQETGLAYVRLSFLEEKLNQVAQAEQDLQQGQTELAGLGWANLAKPHLRAVVAQLDSEYQKAGQENKRLVAATARQ